MKIELLDHGYVEYVTHMGSDEDIIRAARMSTQKGFVGWGPWCNLCLMREQEIPEGEPCHSESGPIHNWLAGDEKLLSYLWRNQHTTPFEFGSVVVEVRAPIMVFREWQRHRTQSYNEASARYSPLAPEDYIPNFERVVGGARSAGSNKQAQGHYSCNEVVAERWLAELDELYRHAESVYQDGLSRGVPKELARLALTCGRYSTMRASANLWNWLKFLRLREDEKAQWEIREYAGAVHQILAPLFPRTMKLFEES